MLLIQNSLALKSFLNTQTILIHHITLTALLTKHNGICNTIFDNTSTNSRNDTNTTRFLPESLPKKLILFTNLANIYVTNFKKYKSVVTDMIKVFEYPWTIPKMFSKKIKFWERHTLFFLRG